ncbi:MAG: YcjF family protein [Dichotomicrobium sp.]
MPILAHLDAALDDPESWAGLFAAANDAELAAIAEIIAPYAPEAGSEGATRTLDREWLAAGAAALAVKVHGQPGPMALARWSLRRLGARPGGAERIDEVEACLLSLLAARLGLDVTSDRLIPSPLTAVLPEAVPDAKAAELAALYLAVEAACLRRVKRARLHRAGGLLALGGIDAPAPLPDPASIAGQPEAAEGTGNRWRDLMDAAGRVPLDIWEQRLNEARAELGRFNIIVAGRTGVGKTTLIGAVFGKEVGDTLAGRPRTRGRVWYPEEPGEGDVLRLCDTEGLEIERFRETLDGLRAEIAEANRSDDAFDHIHAAWLCIDEPSLTVQPGEEKAVVLFRELDVPVICVLTKAGMAPDFHERVREILPDCAAVVRVRAQAIEMEGQSFQPMGLDELMAETERVIPDVVEKAFAVASRNLEAMSAKAMQTVRASAGAAGAAGSTPLPLADAAAVFGVQAGMIVRLSLQMGVPLERGDLRKLAATLLGALGLTASGRFLAGRAIKFIPGIGQLAGSAITGATAAALTYGLGHAYVSFLRRFHARHRRMPRSDEIISGFQSFWREWRSKHETPPQGTLHPQA